MYMQRQPSILWFGGSCSRIVVLTTSLILKDFVAARGIEYHRSLCTYEIGGNIFG